ncbi:unnamed protein product [Didymodactylos carnosus]|uniref:Uncharacterized protein n=1 Tax=Didymodactylos carnosus TaxID=1234261 RepID=A0A8S2F2H5_9BILA|nr:unnamed protein product [Didymodactylos carnosus]CAF4186359.1 unnamed protein product [Didymodactylos carnosus]
MSRYDDEENLWRPPHPDLNVIISKTLRYVRPIVGQNQHTSTCIFVGLRNITDRNKKRALWATARQMVFVRGSLAQICLLPSKVVKATCIYDDLQKRKSNLMVNHTQLIDVLNNITNKNVENRNKNEIQLNGAGPSGQSQSCSRNKATSPVHVTNITRTHVKDQQRTILEPQNTQSSITIENIYPEISEPHASHLHFKKIIAVK